VGAAPCARWAWHTTFKPRMNTSIEFVDKDGRMVEIQTS